MQWVDEATPQPSKEYFDHEWPLGELLRSIDREALQRALNALCGPEAALSDAQGNLLLGRRGVHATVRMPIGLVSDPQGYVEGPSEVASRLRPVADLIAIIAHSELGYCMASALHLDVVQADYEELQKKNVALSQSEARYRKLSEELQARLEEKIKILEATHRKLYESEKLASVGQLAAGLAHEINNPLGFIKSNLSTARVYMEQLETYARTLEARDATSPEDSWRASGLDTVLEDFPQLIRESAEGADRIANIVANLKDFSRVDGSGVCVEDINQILRTVCTVAMPQTQDRATIEVDLTPVPPLRCDPARLAQAFLNLVINAAQAMEERGRIRLSTATSDGRIHVRIQDTGKGIPAEILPRIFEPFFTTREVGRGTGLGLTVCHDVIKAHGGEITVESTLGSGTTFTITLPVRG